MRHGLHEGDVQLRAVGGQRVMLVVLNQLHHCTELQGLCKAIETAPVHDSDQTVNTAFSAGAKTAHLAH